MSAATYLNEGEPVNMKNNIVTISFPKNYSLHKESLDRQENKAIIEKTISELFNTKIRVDFLLSDEVSNKEEDNEDNPSLKSALDMFKGRVIKEE
jgi:hypothetical protein